MNHKQRKENLVQSIHLKRERTDPYSTTTKTLSNISNVESIQFETNSYCFGQLRTNTADILEIIKILYWNWK